MGDQKSWDRYPRVGVGDGKNWNRMAITYKLSKNPSQFVWGITVIPQTHWEGFLLVL